MIPKSCRRISIGTAPMPNAFKAYPKHPAVAYLTRLHADIGGRILENKKQTHRLAADMIAVEAVIRMFRSGLQRPRHIGSEAHDRQPLVQAWHSVPGRPGRAADGQRADDGAGGNRRHARSQRRHGRSQEAAA